MTNSSCSKYPSLSAKWVSGWGPRTPTGNPIDIKPPAEYRLRTTLLSLGILFLSLLSLGCQPTPPLAEALEPRLPPHLVGATYYLDFPERFGRGYLRGELDPPQMPQLGNYHSVEGTVVEQHIAWASAYGIDFFALDYWPGRPPEDVRPLVFLNAGNIADIQFCLSYQLKGLGYHTENDAIPVTDETVERFVADLEQVADVYLEHPQYLRLKGRPVILLRDSHRLYGHYAELLKQGRAALANGGPEPLFIGDEMTWESNSADSVNPDLKPERASQPQKQRIQLLDAVIGYQLYDGSRNEHGGYAAASSYLQDVKLLTQRFIDSTSGNIPVVPSILPGYNVRASQPDSGVIPRLWKVESAPNSFLLEQIDQFAVPFLDERLPLILINSWNDWSTDTALEPLSPAPATSAPEAKTSGFSYSGDGPLLLAGLQSKLTAISGRVVDSQGRALQGMAVGAWKDGKVQAVDQSDSQGRFHLSRIALTAGNYQVGAAASEAITVTLKPNEPLLDLTIKTYKSPAEADPPQLDLEPKFPVFQEARQAFLTSPVEALTTPAQEPLQLDLEALLKPGDTVVEADAKFGAHTGAFSVLVGEEGQVLAFEADRYRHRELHLNTDLRNVSVLGYELCDQIGITGSGETVTERRTLDSFQIPQIKLLKIDCSGREVALLEGGRETIDRCQPKIVLRLGSDSNLAHIRGHLASQGYRLAELASANDFLGTPLGAGPDRTLVDLGLSGHRPFLKSGLSWDEHDRRDLDYVWSDQPESMLELPIRQLRPGEYTLGLRIAGFAPISPLKAAVFLNGAEIGVAEATTEFQGVEFSIPEGLVVQGTNALVLRYSQTGRPSLLNPGSLDGRSLAVSLDLVWLAPEEPAP